MSVTVKKNLNGFAHDNLLTLANLDADQAEAIEQVTQREHLILLGPMGSGKTIISLTALKILLDQYVIDRVLVFAPLRVCQTVWRQQAEEWSHTKELVIRAALGSASKRARVIESDAQIVLINYENMSWFFDKYGADHDFDMVVYDEGSKMKGRGERWKRIRKYAGSFARSLELTGTFTSNGLEDMFTQVFLISQKIFGKAFGKWQEQYFKPIDFNRYKWKPVEGAHDTLMAMIKPITHQIDEETYKARLGAIRVNPINVQLPVKVMSKYKEFKKELVLELENDDHIIADSMAVLTMKLQQVVQGFVYTPDEGSEWIHKEKRKALNDIIDEAHGAPVIAVYKFKEELNYLQNEMGAECLTGVSSDRAQDIVERWNRGEIPLLALHPLSGGHGLNLQKGGNIMVWLGLPWSLEEWQQTIARIYRRGQPKTVWIHTILADGTIDGSIYAALSSKKNTQEAVMESLK